VGWDASVHSLALAKHHYASEEAQDFLNKCLAPITNILLDQQ
jgi:hypothetical protein